jgi:hypothetical protein
VIWAVIPAPAEAELEALAPPPLDPPPPDDAGGVTTTEGVSTWMPGTRT